jgi:hypothetical protein
MPKFQTPKDFIITLYQNKELITKLFENRNISLELSKVLATLDNRTEERLPYLIDNEVVNLSENMISLDAFLVQIIENFLGAETIIDIGKAQRLIDEIKDNKQYYLDEKRTTKKDEYLVSVKRSLRQAGKVIVQQIRLLQVNIKAVYETETDFKIKLAKLEKFGKQWLIIYQLYEELNKILKDDIFFKNAIDSELQNIVIVVRSNLNIITDNLVVIQSTIVDYLNKARKQNAKTVHFQKIKALRDSANLKAKSTIIEVLTKENSLFFINNIDVKSKIPLDFLETDEGYQIILKADKKQKSKQLLKSKLADAIDPNFFKNQPLDEPIINLEDLKETYTLQGGDLFKFIQNHDFKYRVTYDKRISLFCKMISFYHNDLNISTDMKTDNNDVSYAVVNPKRMNNE